MSRGFTLIEMVVSLAILGLGLGVLMKAYGNDIRRSGQVEAETMALGIAESLLVTVGRDSPLRDGETTGQLPNGFRWHVVVAPFGEPEDRAAWPIDAHQVSAQVSWQESGTRRSISIGTLRLAPSEARR